MQQQVRLVFLGETLQGFDPNQVRRRVGRELRLDKARLARLFSGRRIVLKRAVEPERAFRHVDRFARVGARLRIEAIDPDEVPDTVAGPLSRAPAAAPPRQHSRRSHARRPSRWMLPAALAALLAALAAGLASLWLQHDAPARAAARPTVRAAMPARSPTIGQRPEAAAQAAQAWPQLVGPAAQVYRDLYQPAKAHKAFAAAPDGRWGWTGDAPSAPGAVDAARAACEAGRLPEAPRCEVISVDGDEPLRAAPPASPSNAPR